MGTLALLISVTSNTTLLLLSGGKGPCVQFIPLHARVYCTTGQERDVEHNPSARSVNETLCSFSGLRIKFVTVRVRASALEYRRGLVTTCLQSHQ